MLNKYKCLKFYVGNDANWKQSTILKIFFEGNNPDNITYSECKLSYKV